MAAVLIVTSDFDRVGKSKYIGHVLNGFRPNY
jgi:hypothetical protein